MENDNTKPDTQNKAKVDTDTTEVDEIGKDEENTEENLEIGISLEIQQWINSFPVLSEKDFLPPKDTRYTDGYSGIIGDKDFDEFADDLYEICIDNDCYEE